MEEREFSTNPEGEHAFACVEEGGSELLVFNDEEHTFEYVIECLETICELSTEQAATCTNIIHYKGLCIVKHGSKDTLKKMCASLIAKGLKAEVR